MSNNNKVSKQERRIRQLEQEIADLKKRLLVQQQTVKFDEQQMDLFIERFKKEVCFEKKYNEDIRRASDNILPIILKIALCTPFAFVVIAICMFYFDMGEYYWSLGWHYRYVLFVVATIAFDCMIIIVEIFKEKDRNYIVSLFSAIVALTALIVTLTNR